MKITPDVRDLWEKKLEAISHPALLKTLSNWIKSEPNRPKICQFIELARHFSDKDDHKNELLIDLIRDEQGYEWAYIHDENENKSHI